MRQRHSGLHSKHLGIDRAQAYGVFKAIDGFLGLASKESQVATEEPCRGKIRVEHERSIQKIDPRIEVSAEMSKGMSAAGKGDGIALAEIDSTTRQARAFGDFLLRVVHPTVEAAGEQAPRGHAIGRREVGIERDRRSKHSRASSKPSCVPP